MIHFHVSVAPHPENLIEAARYVKGLPAALERPIDLAADMMTAGRDFRCTITPETPAEEFINEVRDAMPRGHLVTKISGIDDFEQAAEIANFLGMKIDCEQAFIINDVSISWRKGAFTAKGICDDILKNLQAKIIEGDIVLSDCPGSFKSIAANALAIARESGRPVSIYSELRALPRGLRFVPVQQTDSVESIVGKIAAHFNLDMSTWEKEHISGVTIFAHTGGEPVFNEDILTTITEAGRKLDALVRIEEPEATLEIGAGEPVDKVLERYREILSAQTVFLRFIHEADFSGAFDIAHAISRQSQKPVFVSYTGVRLEIAPNQGREETHRQYLEEIRLKDIKWRGATIATIDPSEQGIVSNVIHSINAAKLTGKNVLVPLSFDPTVIHPPTVVSGESSLRAVVEGLGESLSDDF